MTKSTLLEKAQLRVVILAQYFPPDMGGSATRAFNMAKGLAENNCYVTIITAFPHYPAGNIPSKYKWKPFAIEKDSGLRIIRVFVPPLPSEGIVRRIFLFWSFAIFSLIGLLLIGKADIVWAANPNIISMYPGVVYKKIKQCPLVQNVDDLWPEVLYDLNIDKGSLITRIGEILSCIAYSFSSALTPISPAYRKVLSKKYNIDSRKIHVIPAGVDIQRFPKKIIRTQMNKDVFTVLYIGAFSLAYDFEQILKAANLLSNYLDIEFIIQGGGELANSLKSKVACLNLNNLQIIEEIVGRNEVVNVMSRADLLLLPLSGAVSIEMGISSKIYEYQAMGKPIICCSNGQPASYIMNTNSGVVVKPGDYVSLAQSILYLKENPDIAKKYGKAGRDYVEKSLSLKYLGSKMLNLFQNLVFSSNLEE